ncbi:hypothetical protein [Streptomyces sp. NPDC047028]|uniref:hypothetical protein n=1 Tax=Streptomyces sp. NPDC047028 TaxID=3155793 RepID=UPI0034070491
MTIHAKGSHVMNSAPQVQTLEISDADLDAVAGGLSPQAGIAAGPTAINSADVLAKLDTVTDTVEGVAGRYGRVGVTVAL